MEVGRGAGGVEESQLLDSDGRPVAPLPRIRRVVSAGLVMHAQRAGMSVAGGRGNEGGGGPMKAVHQERVGAAPQQAHLDLENAEPNEAPGNAPLEMSARLVAPQMSLNPRAAVFQVTAAVVAVVVQQYVY